MPPDGHRIPVIIGVGQVNDRPERLEDGLDSAQLMEAALRLADNDAQGGWLKRLDSLAAVDQISFPMLGDFTSDLATRLGAAPRQISKTPYASGDSPILLLNRAANDIASGKVEVAAVVGGEGLRTAARRAADAEATALDAKNALRSLSARRTPAYRQLYGLVAPVDVYPLYENATRAAYGQTLAAAQSESAAIWSRFSQIAVGSEGAWLRKPVTASEITTPSADNRPIAFPYTKLMVANSSVNQGAGLIVTSLSAARARGIPEHHLVYVRRGAAAHEPIDFLARDRYDHSAGMAVSLRQALHLNNLTSADLDFVELYSCFPCVPKMARRIIDWPIEKPATVFGGLTFGGGPIGNYMSHAVVSMVEALREHGRHGLLFANGGFATHNHSIVLSREPGLPEDLPCGFNFQDEADALRGPIPPFLEGYTGPGTIETYTVFYKRDGSPRAGVVIGKTPRGARFLAKIPATDEAGIAALSGEVDEPVGQSGTAVANGDYIEWRI